MVANTNISQTSKSHKKLSKTEIGYFKTIMRTIKNKKDFSIVHFGHRSMNIVENTHIDKITQKLCNSIKNRFGKTKKVYFAGIVTSQNAHEQSFHYDEGWARDATIGKHRKEITILIPLQKFKNNGTEIVRLKTHKMSCDKYENKYADKIKKFIQSKFFSLEHLKKSILSLDKNIIIKPQYSNFDKYEISYWTNKVIHRRPKIGNRKRSVFIMVIK